MVTTSAALEKAALEKDSPNKSSPSSAFKPGSKLGLYLWLAGFVGVISLLPLLPQIVALSGSEPEVSMRAIQVISSLQSGLLLLLAVWLGLRFSYRFGLSAPIFSHWAYPNQPAGSPTPVNLKGIIYAGIAGGIVGGLALAGFTHLFEPLMPADFLANAEKFSIPLVAKVLYGGITEEILIRWGLMSTFVWLIDLLSGGAARRNSSWVFVAAIIITSLLFGAGHLPLAGVLAETVTPAMKAYVFLANGFFGLIAGYLYWKRGLESAILAHMIAHIVWVMVG
jgi:membrane protease YdiL (CAAX protease family)